MELTRRPLKTLLTETTHAGCFSGCFDTVSTYTSSHKARMPDPVERYRRWRLQCPDYFKRGHAAGCERCDAFPHPTGGVDWKDPNPLTKPIDHPEYWPRP
jgi:hypothetical protein